MARTGSEHTVQGVIAGSLDALRGSKSTNRHSMDWRKGFRPRHIDFKDAAIAVIREVLGEEVPCSFADGDYVPYRPGEGFPEPILQRKQGRLVVEGVKLRVEGSREGLRHEGGVQPTENWHMEIFADSEDTSSRLPIYSIPITCRAAFAVAAILQGRVSGTEHLQVIEQ